MKKKSGPGNGAGRVSANAGGRGRVSNPPLHGLPRAEVGASSEAVFIAITFTLGQSYRREVAFTYLQVRTGSVR